LHISCYLSYESILGLSAAKINLSENFYWTWTLFRK
jgi:hypothetical protein